LWVIEFGVARASRRQHGVRRIDVVVAHVAVVIDDVIAVDRSDLVEHVGLHGQPRNEARNVIGRAVEKTARQIGDCLVCLGSPYQVIGVLRHQKVHAVAFAVGLERHKVAIGGIGLEVV
jgi:hypothetical protein